MDKSQLAQLTIHIFALTGIVINITEAGSDQTEYSKGLKEAFKIVLILTIGDVALWLLS